MEDKILFTIDAENIARLTFNRPHVHNAFDKEMIQKLTETFQYLHKIPSARALVIQGKGKSFCSGVDIAWLNQAFFLPIKDNIKEVQELALMFTLLDTLPIPTIVYVHGAVRGGGMGFLACSDIVLAHSETIFSFSETKWGLVPAVIAPYVIRTMGSRQCRRYFLTGETFGTSSAHHIHLIHEILKSEEIDAEIETYLRHILTGGPQAIRLAKNLIQDITGNVSPAILKTTTELLANSRLSAEGRQGITSFIEKRPPPWILERFQDD